MRVLGLLLLVCLIGIAAKYLFLGGEDSEKPEIITKASLEKILDVSDLSTFEAVYNGIAAVENFEDPEQIDYYVYYEAKVKAGMDFQQIEVSVDPEQKQITITAPPVKITDVSVDITSLDYIFQNAEANTGSIAQEAYRRCIEDVTQETRTETEIYALAEENGKNIIEALVNPFVKQLDADYVLSIV